MWKKTPERVLIEELLKDMKRIKEIDTWKKSENVNIVLRVDENCHVHGGEELSGRRCMSCHRWVHLVFPVCCRQELNRMRSRSVSRRSAPPASAVEGNLSRMRSRSAHREQDRHSWVSPAAARPPQTWKDETRNCFSLIDAVSPLLQLLRSRFSFLTPILKIYR